MVQLQLSEMSELSGTFPGIREFSRSFWCYFSECHFPLGRWFLVILTLGVPGDVSCSLSGWLKINNALITVPPFVLCISAFFYYLVTCCYPPRGGQKLFLVIAGIVASVVSVSAFYTWDETCFSMWLSMCYWSNSCISSKVEPWNLLLIVGGTFLLLLSMKSLCPNGALFYRSLDHSLGFSCWPAALWFHRFFVYKLDLLEYCFVKCCILLERLMYFTVPLFLGASRC